MFRSKDFLSGLMLALFGGGALLQSQAYRMGSATQMGPGFFPALLGGALALIGVVLMAGARSQPGGRLEPGETRLRALVLPILAVAIFGLLLQPLGLVTALAAMIFLVSFASPGGSLLELAAMIVAISTIVVAIFAFGLSISLKVWPL